MAAEIRKRRVKIVNENGMQLIEYDDISEQWVQRFLHRHPELASVRPQSIDAVRVQDTLPERLKRWFDDLEKVIAEYNIKCLVWFDINKEADWRISSSPESEAAFIRMAKDPYFNP